MRGLWILGLLSLTACAAILHGGRETEPTLEVTNEGTGYVRIRAVYGVTTAGDTLGLPLGTVFAGRTECLHLETRSTPQHLRIYSDEGVFDTPTFVTTSRIAWRMNLTGHPEADRLALEPAPSRCK